MLILDDVAVSSRARGLNVCIVNCKMVMTYCRVIVMLIEYPSSSYVKM